MTTTVSLASRAQEMAAPQLGKECNSERKPNPPEKAFGNVIVDLAKGLSSLLQMIQEGKDVVLKHVRVNIHIFEVSIINVVIQFHTDLNVVGFGNIKSWSRGTSGVLSQ